MKNILLIASFIFIFVSSTTITKAASGTWSGASGNWSDTGIWDSGTIADGTDSTANFTFDITAAASVVLDTIRTIGNIVFTDSTTSSHDLTISGANTLTLDTTSGTPDINVTQSDRILTMSSVIAGVDGLSKTGSGILNLSGANTYSGLTTVSAGTLRLQGADPLKTTRTYQINSGAVLNLNGGAVYNTVPGNSTFNGTGTLRLSGGYYQKSGSGGGSLTINMGAAGLVDIQSGANIANYYSLPSPFNSANQATLNLDGLIGGNSMNWIIYVGSLTGAGTISNSAFTWTLNVGNGNGSGTFSGIIGNTATGVLNLYKKGTGTQTLSGTNTYTGLTSVDGGTLKFAKTASLLAASWTKTKVSVNNGTTIAFNVGGTDEFSSGNVTTLLTGLGGTVTNNGLRAGSTIAFDTANASGGTFTISDTIANTTGTGGGAVGLTKLGAGTLTLSGSNTYTGNTTVATGTLAFTTAVPASNNWDVSITNSTTNALMTLPNNPDLTGKTINISTTATDNYYSTNLITWTGTAVGTPTLKINGATVTSGVFYGDDRVTYSTSTGAIIFTRGNLPGTVDSLVVTDISDSSITFDWSTVVSADGYELSLNGIATTTQTATSKIYTGLNPDTEYTFAVAAYNSTGTSTPTTIATTTLPWSVPAQISPKPVVSNIEKKQVTLSWTEPADNGNAIEYYTITSNPAVAIATSTATSTIITGLSRNTEYTFTVTAHNIVGDSIPSEPSEIIKTKSGGSGVSENIIQSDDVELSNTLINIDQTKNDLIARINIDQEPNSMFPVRYNLGCENQGIDNQYFYIDESKNELYLNINAKEIQKDTLKICMKFSNTFFNLSKTFELKIDKSDDSLQLEDNNVSEEKYVPKICSPYINDYIRPNYQNPVESVKKLQTFLNKYEGENLTIDGIYKQADIDAVNRFQLKHRETVLDFWNIDKPTGYVFVSTSKAINRVVCEQDNNLTCPYFIESNINNTFGELEIIKIRNFLSIIEKENISTTTTIFDPELELAINRFQTKYADSILKPWNLKNPTGLWYQSTRKKADELLGCYYPVRLDNGVVLE